ncbi:MAG: phytanoyl-CoA dioxygenase family protein [Halioglobus sp.]
MIDQRTRSEDSIVFTPPSAFFGGQFQTLVSQGSALIAPWLEAKKLKPFMVECDGQCWLLQIENGQPTVRVVLDSDATLEEGAHLRINADDFSGLVNDLYTPTTFFSGGDLDMPRGHVGHFMSWWLLLRALIDKRPLHVPGMIDFSDLNGGELDLTRSFSLEDSIIEMRHFLETAGFLHLRGVFTEDEMAAVSAEMDAAHGSYHEGDGKSWWASTADGKRQLVRMQSFDQRSPATAKLLQEARFQKIADIPDENFVHQGLEDNVIEALFKPIGVVEGLSDLPFHKDCAQGRHSFDCCLMIVGISVTGAGAESGQLGVIAGSHRALMPPSMLSDPHAFGLPVVPLPTDTGDITVHLSCTHHAAYAPTERERRVMYTSFRFHDVSVATDNDSRAKISKARESAYTRLSDK